LIIGRHDDPHTESVTLALMNLGRSVECVDSFRGDRVEIRITSSGDKVSALRLKGSSRLTDTNVEAVRLRQKPVIPMPWWSTLQHNAANFAHSERRTVIQTLEDCFPSAYWINSPEAKRRINYKPKQEQLRASYHRRRTLSNLLDQIARCLPSSPCAKFTSNKLSAVLKAEL
jgi:hypothetical protein